MSKPPETLSPHMRYYDPIFGFKMNMLLEDMAEQTNFLVAENKQLAKNQQHVSNTNCKPYRRRNKGSGSKFF